MAFVFPHLLHFLFPFASRDKRLAVLWAEVLQLIEKHFLHLALTP